MKDTSKKGKGGQENAWREAFEGAKLEPSEGIWLAVEAAIANDDAARYRRGITYYRWLAAAVILLFVGFLGYVGFRSETANNPVASDIGSTPAILDEVENEGSIASIDHQGSAIDKDADTAIEHDAIIDQDVDSSIDNNLLANDLPDERPHHAPDVADKSSSVGLIAQSTPVEAWSQTTGEESDQKQSGLSWAQITGVARKSANFEAAVKPEFPDKVRGVAVYPTHEPIEEGSLWAGINLAPGYFNPNYQSQGGGIAQAFQSPDLALSGFQPAEQHRTGFSMSYGFDMGFKISPRWQLMGGLHYLDNNVQTTTNTVLNERTPLFSSVAESLDFANYANRSVSFVETELDNRFQFLSIPLQAGFMVLDKKLKLQLNAGIANDIFLKNRITATDNSLDPVTIRPGSEAPFRTLYINGLVGAQASYELLPRYLITVEPRYKMAISDFASPDASYTSLPSSFGVGVGLKYEFK